MRQKPAGRPWSSEHIIKDLKRKTRKQYHAEEKIRIVLDGLGGEDSIAERCRREGIAQSLYYKWSKDFMEAGCPSSNKWDRCLVLLRECFAHHFHVTRRVVDSANDVSR